MITKMTDTPAPLQNAEILSLALAMASGKPVRLGLLLPADARAILRTAAAIIARWKELGLAMPPPRRPPERQKAALESLGVTPGEIVAGIFDEPLMQGIIVMLAQATAALLPVPVPVPVPGPRVPR